MRFTPRYMVSYKGSFYTAGNPFDIDSADAEEMSKHGVLMQDSKTDDLAYVQPDTNHIDVEKRQYKAKGRPRKNQE